MTLCIRNLLDGSKHNVSTRRSRSLSRHCSKPNTEVILQVVSVISRAQKLSFTVIILYGTSRLISHSVQLSYTKGGYSTRCDFLIYLNVARDGHYLYLQTQFGEDRCMQFQVIVVTDPHTHTDTQTDRTDYNTLCRS